MMIVFVLVRLLIPGAAMAATAIDTPAEVITSPRVAQVRLVEALASADAIDSVRARGDTITFSLARGDSVYEVTATTRVRGMTSRRDEVIALTIDTPRRSASLRAPAEPGLSIHTPLRSASLRAPAEPGLSIHTPRRSRGGDALGGLTWLRDEFDGVTAITRLHADDDGAVTLTTSDDRRYMLITGHGSGGNAAAEARFAAEFDR